jgi:2-amino-4-hydroxy-6-hydroxymethyldihydropteridine diphosphokinase
VRTPVAIALGSNLGDRDLLLSRGLKALSSIVENLRVSTFHDTEPLGVGPQPRFLNAAATGVTALSAPRLLEQMLDIERQCGRERLREGAPRTLDLDLVLYGDLIATVPGMIVPHPRFRERRFVLSPLAEIAGQWIDPVSGLSVAALLARLE